MRLFLLLYAVLLGFFTTHLANAATLETCLQERLNQVLAGDHVASHMNVRGLLFLTIGRKNYDKIKDDPAALSRFEDMVVSVISRRIKERGQRFVGATLDLNDTGDRYSIEGVIMANTEYFINVTFVDRKDCRVNDISIHGHFHLRRWVAEQPEMQALMKVYKMAR